LRVIWYSNAPWCGTGYGQQTALQVPKLQSLGHDVAVAAFHGLQGAPLNWGGMTVYPGSSEDSWAQDVMLGHYQQHKADLLITLMDAWVLDPVKLSDAIGKGMRVAHWQPVDCEPLSVMDHRILSACGARPIAMSRHGERMLAEFDPLYVPHSVDTSVFTPVTDEMRAEARSKGDFSDKFLIGINAANQDPVRKGFGEQLAAFRLFADRHPDARMLIHTRKQTRSGSNLEKLVEVLHLQDLVHFGDQYLTVTGLTSQAEVARWYGVCDIVSNCSYGEGFGLPALEAQAAGTPVVVTDCSALAELCGGGWLVDGEYYWNAGHSAWWTRPSIQGILAAYEQAYAERGTPDAEKRRAAAREFALQYDADLVLRDYWVPALAALEEQSRSGQVVQAAGLKWRVGDSVDHGDRLGPAHEETVEQAVLDLLPEGGVFLDVGAHVGHYALRAAATADAVIAVECNPATAARLQENLDLNDIRNVTIHQVAAWDKVERLRMDARDGHERSGDTRVTPDGDGTVTGMPLDRVLSTDRVLKKAGRLDLIKLDVEGADLHALRGMAGILAKYRPVMVIEDHSVYDYYKLDDLRDLLAELGYGMRELGMYGCAPYLLAEPVPA
jgi:FkbM family methyltransferase